MEPLEVFGGEVQGRVELAGENSDVWPPEGGLAEEALVAEEEAERGVGGDREEAGLGFGVVDCEGVGTGEEARIGWEGGGREDLGAVGGVCFC